MHETEARIYLIAETQINTTGLAAMLTELGTDWWPQESPDGETLVEVAGRLCYKSFEVGLNKNVTKIRENPTTYFENLLKSRHGSVLEHSTVSFAFLNVSRILTHELVRHRAGCAYSQESMRFVRMDDIPIHIPDLKGAFDLLVEINPDLEDAQTTGRQLQVEFSQSMRDAASYAEELIRRFSGLLDHPKVSFGIKKKITSALRRMAPGGHTTNIIMTANHRAYRSIIEQRTAPGSEDEIKHVMCEVGRLLKNRFPNIYQDMIWKVEGWEFSNRKV